MRNASVVLVVMALSIVGCASSNGKSSRNELTRLGLPPDAKPTETYWNGREEYNVYVFEKDGELHTKVCIKYRQTGSRMWRNSCEAGGPPNVVSLMNPDTDVRTSRAVYGQVGQTPPLGTTNATKESADTIEATVNNMIRGKVTITDVDKEPKDPKESEESESTDE